MAPGKKTLSSGSETVRICADQDIGNSPLSDRRYRKRAVIECKPRHAASISVHNKDVLEKIRSRPEGRKVDLLSVARPATAIAKLNFSTIDGRIIARYFADRSR